MRRGFSLLFLGSELRVRLGDPGLRRIAVMDEHAVAEDERAARWNVIAPVPTAVTGKRLEAERIRRQQTVRAGVPVRGCPQIMRVVKDRETDILACHLTVVVDPVRALAPDRLLAAGAAGIHHLTGR